MKNIIVLIIFVLFIVLFFGVVVINNELLGYYCIDLIEDKVYFLLFGSQKVLDELDELIVLYFFFLDFVLKGMIVLCNYVNCVQSLLEEYVSCVNGKIMLKVIDFEFFFEVEDFVVQYGLIGVMFGLVGEVIYFGLVGMNVVDDQFSIGFFDFQQEIFFEYDISKFIYQLSDFEFVFVMLLMDLNLFGG